MTAQELKNSILQLAIQGKLVKQDPNDEPASVLLEKIKEEREKLIKEKKIKREKYSEIYKDPSDNHYYEKFEKLEPIDITDEIPFDIPNNWNWIRICNCADIYTGNSISETVKNTKYMGVKEGYNYIGTKDVNFDNTINYDNEVKIPFNEPKFKKAYKDNTLICVEGGSAGRKVAKLSKDVCFGNKLATINSWIINPEYIYLFFQSSIIQNFFKNNMTGIIGGVSINKLKTLLIPIPPLREQKRIVCKYQLFISLISKYDNEYCKIEKLNANYKEQLKKSILQYAIQGKLVKQDPNDESAENLINKILDKKCELIKAKQIKKENLSVIYKDSTDNQFYEKFDDGKIINITEEIPFDIPDSWRWIRFENLVIKQIKRGKSPKYVDKSNVYVFAQKCNPKNGKITLENAKFLDEEILNKYDESDFINKNDIVINSTGNGTLGRIGIIDEERIYLNKIVVDSHVTLIRINKNYINPYYIFYLLKTYQRYLESQASGSTNQTELSPEVIKKLLIPLPCTNEQNRVISKINSLLNLI